MEEYRKNHDQLIAKLEANPNDMDARMQLLRSNVLWAKEIASEQGPNSGIAALAREVLEWGPLLIEMGGQGMSVVYSVTGEMQELIYTRPRLKREIMSLQLEVLDREEAMSGHEMQITDKLRREINALSSNIDNADKGNFDEISQSGTLKSDPVEWTARWEEVIDEAETKAYAQLKDVPRGMGFCHAYWSTLREILSKDYQLDWRSPREMNPRVLFD